MLTLRKLMSYLPANNTEKPPYTPPTDWPDRMEDRLNQVVPENPAMPYDLSLIHI